LQKSLVKELEVMSSAGRKRLLFILLFACLVLYAFKSGYYARAAVQPEGNAEVTAINVAVDRAGNLPSLLDPPATVYPGSSYILNTGGSAPYSPSDWKPHQVGFEKAVWSINAGDGISMFLNNQNSEFGHIACGSWWTPNFINGTKLPLKNVKSLIVSVDVCLTGMNYDISNSLLRMAVAGAITLPGGSRYTELDFWDSPRALSNLYPDRDKYYNGIDEYSYHADQVHAGHWYTLSSDFIPYICNSWGDLSSSALESVYLVIESDCRKNPDADEVTLCVKNLVIRVTE
jgi:hypothetical protein